MRGWYDEAKERLEREYGQVHGQKETAMRGGVRDALLEFCRQNGEFAQAVAQGGSFKDVVLGDSIDADTYQENENMVVSGGTFAGGGEEGAAGGGAPADAAAEREQRRLQEGIANILGYGMEELLGRRGERG